MLCPECGNETTQVELNTYNEMCEDCYVNDRPSLPSGPYLGVSQAVSQRGHHKTKGKED
jgi:NMD protein affecting ribosome stability and mRNA decay